MGDRDNPIKFGPEWLRNLAGERGAGSTGGPGSSHTHSQSSAPGPSGGAGPGTRRTGASGDSFAGASASSSSNGTVGVRVQLANLRYGREEMLALYEAAADPPQELTNNEILYQPRSKLPFALSTSFDDEMRENLRSSPHTGGVPGDRFGLGRGAGRGLPLVADNPRPRFRTTGSTVLNRPRNLPLTTGGHFSGDSQDSGVRPQLGQRSTRYQSTSEHKPVFYPNYVGANNMFRSKRQTNTTSTNWRSSQTRDSGEEWRSAEPGRARTGQDRERDRERPSDRPTSSSHRRSTSDHNDETIPEWAFANAEACGGTFDSLGAFHGYSNDDSNLPKNQDNGYSLSRSRTQNNLTRSKTAEEGSDEWWASEKAKKLSPKRFDAGDIKFKQGPGILDGPLNAMGQNSKSNPHKEEHDTHKESPRSSPEISVKDTGDFEDSYNKNKGYKQQFSESKPFDSMMRQDISIEEAHSASANDQRGNFKSVMITPNNSLRQKHQNIVSAANESPASRAQSLMAMKAAFSSHGQPETDMTSKQHHTFEDKMMDDFLDMTLESDELGSSVLMGAAGAGLSGMSNNALQDRGLQLGLQSSSHPGQSLSMSNAQKLSSLGLQGGGGGMGTPGMNPHVMSPQMEFGAGGGMGLPMQGVQQGVLPGAGLGGHLERAGYQSGMPNVGNNSLFMGKSSSGSSQTERPLSGHAAGAMFPLHALQAGPAQAFPGGYSMLQPGQPPAPLADQWYYEDPDKNTQGPFSSREMYTWYRAGFFTPSLMVRRACEREMRPLGSYGHLVPFVDVLPPYPMAGYESRAPLNQSALGLAVMSMSNNDKPIPMPPSAQNAMQNSLQSAMQNKVEGSSMQGGHSPQLLASPIQMIQNAIIQNIGPASMPGAPHFANVALTRNGPHAQQNMFDSLWGQASPDVLWMQRNPPLENRVNNLPLCFWDQQPSAMASNSLLPEDITKEMKTEDQILAQLRANQSLSAQAGAPALAEPKPAASMAAPATSKPLDAFSTPITPTYFEELHKIIHKEPATTPATHSKESSVDTRDAQPPKQDKVNKPEQTTPEANIAKSQQNNATKETKSNKQSKTESDKTVKNKENNSTKSKNKKKDDKKDDAADVKVKEDNSNKSEPKRSVESSPVKYKKEDKTSKKDIEKEKKEWIKEGFTIVKGPEKSTTKDTKKKAEEAKIAEEADKKRKEEEKLAADDEKKKRIADAAKKQQEPQSLCTSKSSADCGGGGGGGGGGSVSSRKAWSSQSAAAPAQEHPTLAEIQRLEREKKLEQMREQQQMMQIIALQQAQQLAREQEMQANLAWAKKKTASQPAAGPSLAEIQAQEQVSRKQQLAAAPPPAPAPAPPEEERAPPAAPWGQPHNGESQPPTIQWPTSGFWDSPAPQAKAPEPKQQEPKPEVPKVVKKKAPAAAPVAGSAAPAVAPPAPPAPAAPAAPPAPPAPPKKVTTPAVEFDTWCTTTLKSWSSKIDVPTFIGFLKDIESPYEVKDYVRCYLGEARETADFARSFLERRSKLLRGGTVSPPDDLCSPALAVTPRAAALPDYADLKGKAKKTKKNKMLKVDARFLGFSATAAEDRINVGDIDTV